MEQEKVKKKWWHFGRQISHPVVESTLTTMVPIDIAIEKLRGFVSDHKAKIVATNENSVSLEVSSETISYDRRKTDRHVTFCVELQFHEDQVERSNNTGCTSAKYLQTRVELSIRPKRASRGRKADQAERAQLLLQSIKSYLMAKEGNEENAELLATAEN